MLSRKVGLSKHWVMLASCLAAGMLSSCSPPKERSESENDQGSAEQNAPAGGATKIPVPIISTATPTPIPAPPPQVMAPVEPEEPPPPPPPPPTPPPIATPSEIVKEYSDSLVFVTGEGAGSGFIANMGGKPFFLTNAHVAVGVREATFTTLQGMPVAPGPASVAVGHDIVAMQTKPSGVPLEIMRDVARNISIGDQIVVLGNSQGGGVINTIVGSVIGIGPGLVETDALFQPGNSGSPIVHLKTKKVIGVATYLTIQKFDPATRQPVPHPIVRRFGYRIDSVKTWQPINWAAFYSQAAEISSIDKLTVDLITLIKDIADDSRVIRAQHTNPAIRSRINAWIDNKSKHMSPLDAANADQNFLSFLKSTCQGDISIAQQHFTYDYFQRQLAERQRERTEIAGVFGKIIEITK